MPRRATASDPSQLLLFEAPTATATATPTTTAPRFAPAPPPSVSLPAAPVEPAPAPAALLSSVLAPAVFRHPLASREIVLNEHVVAYEFKRSKRRSIGFVVGTDGLGVNAPKWVGIGDIEAALREKGAWILRKLAEQQQRTQRLQAAKVDWRDGTAIPFLGEPVIVVLDPRAGLTQGGAVLNTDATALPGVARLALHIGLTHTATPAQIRDSVQSWLQRQARRVFEDRCQHFTAQLGVRVTRLSLSSAQTRWGSASADGSIRLNWRLIHFALPMIDYVVAHELAHLREMNHSPRFWDVVRSVLPDYEQARGRLKDDVVPVFD